MSALMGKEAGSLVDATDLFGYWTLDRVGAFLFYNDVYNVGTMSGRTLVSLDQAPPQFTAHSCDSCDVHKYLWIPRHCGPDHSSHTQHFHSSTKINYFQHKAIILPLAYLHVHIEIGKCVANISM